MYGDQIGEFVSGFRGLRGEPKSSKHFRLPRRWNTLLWHILLDHFYYINGSSQLKHTLCLSCFGWGVRGGYSCSSYLSTIIFAFSSPLRVPRPWSLQVRPFWLSQVNLGWKIGTITETGLLLASVTAFQTSIVQEFCVPPPPPRILSDLPFLCIFSSKNQAIPHKFSKKSRLPGGPANEPGKK